MDKFINIKVIDCIKESEYTKTLVFKKNELLYGWFIGREVEVFHLDLHGIGWPCQQYIREDKVCYGRM